MDGSSTADTAWALARLAIVLGLPAIVVHQLIVRPQWRQPFQLGILVLAPCLITLWFLHDGGLGNGLNRLGYYLATGVFFAGYALLMAIIHLVLRARRQPSRGHLRAMCCSALALLAWVCGTVAFENWG